MEWLRLYTDILDDEKIAQLSDNQYRIFTFLMLMASENDLGGVVTQSHKAIAWRLRMPVNRIKSAIEKLEALNIISNENNTITFLNWHKRQYKSDNSTERVKRFRNKKETFTPTLENRTEQIQNRTDTDTETLPRAKPIKNKKLKTSIPEDFSISDRVKKWAEDKKHSCLEEHLESFILKSKAKDYQYVDWDDAFMNAIRDNWAKIGNGNGNGHQVPAREPPPLIISCPACGERVSKSDLVDDGCVNCKYGKSKEIQSL